MQKIRQGEVSQTSQTCFFKKALYEVKAIGVQLNFNIFQ